MRGQPVEHIVANLLKNVNSAVGFGSTASVFLKAINTFATMCLTGWHAWCDAWVRVLNRWSTNECSRNRLCPSCQQCKVANVLKSMIDIQKQLAEEMSV
ncbi:hypothetical protein Y032_0165g21 [Ancylostoma ceylanicum]|uniref:Uncharacterized protein n=1 Tax=Ancylostoma ceylanicum TaxID=53326 RepID=A0A016SX33_9BILA|nr:hypothetical protein Y032_0165g21 [Ancylostoma ceylanicum]